MDIRNNKHNYSMIHQCYPQYAQFLPYIFKIQHSYIPLLPLLNQQLMEAKLISSNSDSQDQLRRDSQNTQQISQDYGVKSLDGIKKGCNCRKSKCLKQYCDCFADGQECGKHCQCKGCFNQTEYNQIRDKAILSILNRDPKAFSTKIDEKATKKMHNRGCNCRKSGCSKKYCECYQAQTNCGSLCKCSGCQNCKIINPFDEQSITQKKISIGA